MAQKKHDETVQRLLEAPTAAGITQPVERSLADFAQEVLKIALARGWSLPGGFGTSAESCLLEFRKGQVKRSIRIKVSDIETRSAESLVDKLLGVEEGND